MKSVHRVLLGLLFFAIGSVVSLYAISAISKGWIIGMIVVMNLSTLILVFGVEVNNVEISRDAISIDFGTNRDPDD